MSLREKLLQQAAAAQSETSITTAEAAAMGELIRKESGIRIDAADAARHALTWARLEREHGTGWFQAGDRETELTLRALSACRAASCRRTVGKGRETQWRLTRERPRPDREPRMFFAVITNFFRGMPWQR